MVNEPDRFKAEVQATLRRHVKAINALSAKGMYFWDYGNAFLLESESVELQRNYSESRWTLYLPLLRQEYYGTSLL